MLKNIIIIIPIAIFLSCSSTEKQSPDWIKSLSIPLGYNIVSINGDTMKFSSLANYNFPHNQVNELLQKNTTKIMFFPDILKSNNKNELVFDTISHVYSGIDGKELGFLVKYVPHQSISRFPEDDCWDSCSPLKLAVLGCECRFELSNNYKGFQIMLSFYNRHFKEETSSNKLKILIFKNEVQLKSIKIDNYHNIKDSQIQYFTSDNALYLYHYYYSFLGEKKELILAKFSFDGLISDLN